MTEDSPGSRGQRRAEQRRRIQDAARTVFFRDGFVRANLDEVADIAGVAKGTLYRYFDSKAELYVGVLARDGDSFVERLREVAKEPGHTAPDQLRRLAQFYFEHWSSHAQYFQIFWALENQAVIGELPREIVDEVTRLWETCLSILAELVDRGIEEGHFRDCDSWEVANILWTLGNGIIQAEASPAHRRLRRRGLDLTYADAIDLVLSGLSPSDETR